jgi:L-seryl-tRNA(Ser) seleniumtransferase
MTSDADFRIIPSIEQLRQRPALQELATRYGRDRLVDALRAETDRLRERLSVTTREVGLSAADAAGAIEAAVAARLADTCEPSLRRLINATGVIVHTNLGRAPLADAAVAALMVLARGYTNLEYDLREGRRGRRDAHAESLLCQVTGADAAVVVNNCAAATLLVLTALARGREVVISRGELVEIGGGFRVPDVMAQSGARLREVGTTNRTRAADYAAAIGERTGAILRVHPSNFRLEGFVERAPLASLVEIGRRFGIPIVEDLGSGFVTAGRAESPALRGEPVVQDSIAAGVDVVCFSGDKLLGGPQAGLIVGRGDLVARIRQHPLMRALRVDKLTYAALEATLGEHLAGRAGQSVPVMRMIADSRDAIAARAAVLVDRLQDAGWTCNLREGLSTIGGGSAPGTGLDTVLVAIARDGQSADVLESWLRELDPPVIARIESDQVLLDLRTVLPEEDQLLADLLTQLDA